MSHSPVADQLSLICCVLPHVSPHKTRRTTRIRWCFSVVRNELHAYICCQHSTVC